MTDPIADLLTRIRNAYLAKKAQVELPYSKTKHALSKILKSAGYLEEVATGGKSPHKTLILTLHYIKNLPSITRIDRLSKPGRRLYVRVSGIKSVLSGKGLSIISTSQGLMTDKAARQNNLGGELICKVW